ncbi:MAG: PP2C family protein-serine/threonine phosphatase [Bacteroidota bacterium]
MNESLSREALIENHKELLASIKYASFIQQAILPDKKLLKSALKDYLLFFRPRDIVSGDFYYCSRKDDSVIMAAGDCTGHGVPGALLSIMGISFLNEILSERNSMKASTILNLLRERVMKALHQRGGEDENKDAIDMALCVINFEQMNLQFAGANNSLYHVRDNKLTEIKADKMPVGINAVEEESFTNNTVKLRSGDMIYIFSDGFPDQFGGPRGKKIMYGPFKSLLSKIAAYDVDYQYDELGRYLEAWKGKEPQVDDILVFGVKIN